MEIKKINIDLLIPDPSNARLHDEKNMQAIKGSLTKFGQQKPIVINQKNIVIAGNGTLAAAKALGWKEIACVVSDLGTTEQIAFAIADNRTSDLSTFDDEILSSTLAALKEENFDLSFIGFDDFKIDEKILTEENIYSDKIKAPTYQITGEKPTYDEMLDNTKRDQLILEIKNSNLTAKEKQFLIDAAYRHSVFNYEKIAEFYAHGSKELQDLMEKSALVIIDFNKAIENGFVKLTDELLQVYTNDIE